jgi:hypothetical protein
VTGIATVDGVPGNTGLPQALILIVIFALVVTKLIGLTASGEGAKRLEMRLFLTALGLRFIASLALYEFGLVDVIKDEDASGWLNGVLVYEDWVRRDVSIFQLPHEWAQPFVHIFGTRGYAFLIGTLFYLTDLPASLPAAVISNVCGAATAVVVYRCAALFFSRWVAERSAWAVCLIPSLIIWSAQTLKEPIVIFLETLAIYGCARLKTRGISFTGIIGCIAPVLLLLAFRAYAAYIAAGVVVISLLIPRIGHGHGVLHSGIAVAGVLAIVVLGTGVLGPHLNAMEKFDLGHIQEIRDYTARTTGSGVPLDYDLDTLRGFTMSALVGGVHLLFAPFPWQLGGASLRMVLTVPDAALWWWLFVAGSLPGLAWGIRRRPQELMPLFLFLTAMGVLYSITFSNVGLVYRYRATLMPWLLVFAMVGFEQRRLRRERAREAMARHMASLQMRRFPAPIGTFAP